MAGKTGVVKFGCNVVVSCMQFLHGVKVIVHLLGPFYGAIAVPSVTRCRCCRGHRCAGGVRQWRRATVATPSERQCGVLRLAVANGPNIFSSASCFRRGSVCSYCT